MSARPAIDRFGPDADLDPFEQALARTRSARRRARTRSVLVTLLLAVAVVGAFVLSISWGKIAVPLLEVFPAAFKVGDPYWELVVHTLRLPRTLVALLAGLAFGASGAIFQAFARNPLASPDIIGVTTGASAGGVFALSVAGPATTGIALGALAGGLGAAALIYLLAWKRGIHAYRLVLIGIGVAGMLDSVISYLFTRAQIADAQKAAFWLVGSLNNTTWEPVRPFALAMAVLVPLTLCTLRPLSVLQLGDDTARGLGQRPELARGGVTLVAVLLAAVATAAAGPIAFVAFMSGPIARRLTGSSGAAVIPAALLGALLVLIAEWIGRIGINGIELPVGVITGILGGPYLLWLLARSTRIGEA